jgi:uncharacterized protein (DUF2235 family)
MSQKQRRPLDEMLRQTLDAYESLPEKMPADRGRVQELEEQLKAMQNIKPTRYLTRKHAQKDGVYAESMDVSTECAIRGAFITSGSLKYVRDAIPLTGDSNYCTYHHEGWNEVRAAGVIDKLAGEARKLCKTLGYGGFFMDEDDIKIELLNHKAVSNAFNENITIKYRLTVMAEFYRKRNVKTGE